MHFYRRTALYVMKSTGCSVVHRQVDLYDHTARYVIKINRLFCRPQTDRPLRPAGSGTFFYSSDMELKHKLRQFIFHRNISLQIGCQLCKPNHQIFENTHTHCPRSQCVTLPQRTHFNGHQTVHETSQHSEDLKQTIIIMLTESHANMIRELYVFRALVNSLVC